jgi:hypothetical protein
MGRDGASHTRRGGTCVAAGLWLVACRGQEISLGDALLTPDASVPAPFSAPVAITGLASADGADDDPSLTADLSLILFNSEREGGSGKEDIWFSSRAGADASWSPPLPAAELNTDARETGIALAPDGLTVWFSSDRSGAGSEGGLDVYTARRTRRTDPWSFVERDAVLSSAGDDLVSAVEPLQQRLYLARRATEEDAYDLFVARRSSRDAAWEDPESVSALNTVAAESDAFEFGGTNLVFTRGEDLMLAQHADSSGAFEFLGPLLELNSPSDDRDAWVSADGSYVVFSSDRAGGYRLYEARR